MLLKLQYSAKNRRIHYYYCHRRITSVLQLQCYRCQNILLIKMNDKINENI